MQVKIKQKHNDHYDLGIWSACVFSDLVWLCLVIWSDCVWGFGLTVFWDLV